MMSDPTTVDGTTVDELTGKLVLLIEESRAWDETAHMHRQLATKVKNYVRHIRGPNYEHPPSETIVRLVTARAPAPVSFEFFSRVSYELSKHGVSFEHQVGEDGLPVPIAPEEGVATRTLPETSSRAAPPEVANEASPARLPDSTAEAEAAAREPAIDSVPAKEAPVDEAPLAQEVEEEPAWRVAEGEEEEEGDRAAPVGELWDSREPEGVDTDYEVPEETFEVETSGLEPVSENREPWEVEGSDLEPEPEEREAWEVETSALEPAPAEREPWEQDEESAVVEDLDHSFSGSLPDFGPQDEEEVEELVSHLESLARPAEERPKYPPFFPEEEFGRAVPERDLVSGEAAEIEFLDPDAESASLDTGSGKRIPREVPQAPVVAVATRPNEADQGVSRALGSALASAAAGAAAWGLLSIPADHGAGFLALVVGLMVGMSVRIRGRRSRIFGIIAGVVTVLGSALGAILATCVLTARHVEDGLSAVIGLFTDPGALGSALFLYYGWVDLAFAAVAVYIAARLAVARR